MNEDATTDAVTDVDKDEISEVTDVATDAITGATEVVTDAITEIYFMKSLKI